jgi:hypothetical protein
VSVIIVVGVSMIDEWNWLRVMSVVGVGGGMIGAEWNWLSVMSVIVTGGGELYMLLSERDLNFSGRA